MSAGSCRKMFAKAATSSMIMPMKRTLPMPERSRFVDAAKEAMTAKITAVPPPARPIKLAPLRKPSTTPSMRESMRPMKNVKPSRRATPQPLFFVFSIANMKPKAIARKAMKPMPGLPWKKSNFICTPIHAPSTVGTIERASSA